jgi:hypothetical protein
MKASEIIAFGLAAAGVAVAGWFYNQKRNPFQFNSKEVLESEIPSDVEQFAMPTPSGSGGGSVGGGGGSAAAPTATEEKKPVLKSKPLDSEGTLIKQSPSKPYQEQKLNKTTAPLISDLGNLVPPPSEIIKPSVKNTGIAGGIVKPAVQKASPAVKATTVKAASARVTTSVKPATAPQRNGPVKKRPATLSAEGSDWGGGDLFYQ